MTEMYRHRIPDGPDVVGYRLPGRTVAIGMLVGAGAVRALGQLSRRREQHELYVNDLLRPAIFPGHALGNPTLGTAAGIERLGPGDLQGHHARHYRTGATVLAVAGDFDWSQVLDLAAASLPSAPSPRAGAPAGPDTIELSGGTAGEVRPVARQHIGMALPGPAYGDPDFYTWALITHILGWGFSARLFRTVRERLGLTYAVAARLVAHSRVGHVLLYGTTTPDHAGAFVAGVRDTVRTLAERGVEAEELAAAKVELASELVMRGESTAARMHTALTSAFFEPDVRSIEQIEAAIERVRPGDVEQALSVWRGDPTLAVATVGPIPVEELYSHVQHAVASR